MLHILDKRNESDFIFSDLCKFSEVKLICSIIKWPVVKENMFRFLISVILTETYLKILYLFQMFKKK